jgi:hypothetical protein
MIPVKIFIVTYNNNSVLNEKSLRTLFESKLPQQCQIFIINNHSNLSIDTSYVDRVTVLNNMTRPDFSTGHLARNWNQALINGFRNSNVPDCDLVVCAQTDCQFAPDWLDYITELHQKYDFITFGAGDCFHSYTPNAVKGIGLWDERQVYTLSR